jgi:hypothetical protein
LADDVDGDARALLLKAKKARDHANKLADQRAVTSLNAYASELEGQAAALRATRESKDKAPVLPIQAAEAPLGEPHNGPELMAAMKPPQAEPPEPAAEAEDKP